MHPTVDSMRRQLTKRDDLLTLYFEPYRIVAHRHTARDVEGQIYQQVSVAVRSITWWQIGRAVVQQLEAG